MCLIIACNSTRPQLKVLEVANKHNSDGAGIAYFEGDKLKFKKGTDWDVKDLHKEIQKLPFPFVVHFRKKTKGNINDHMCHPFPIADNAPLVTIGEADRLLFHNGTFKDWDDRLLNMALYRDDVEIPPGEWSDSRALAKMIYHSGEDFLNLIDNRFVIMIREGKVVRRFGKWFNYTKNITQGIDVDDIDDEKKKWDYGMVFSNDYWKYEEVVK